MTILKRRIAPLAQWKISLPGLLVLLAYVAANGQTTNLNGNWDGYMAGNEKTTYVWKVTQNGGALAFEDVGAGTGTKFSGTIVGNKITDSNGVTGTVTPDGNAIFWTNSVVWRRPIASGITFVEVAGEATDIDIGWNGPVWRVGDRMNNPFAGTVGIAKLVDNRWELIDGKAIRVAVNPYGDPWVIDDLGLLKRRLGKYWMPMPSPSVRDIAFGPGDVAWITDKGGYARRWKNGGWNDVWQIDASRIAVDSEGRPWVTTTKGEIKRFDGTNWMTIPGGGVVIAAGGGKVYKVGGDQALSSWTGSGWKVENIGPFLEIAVDQVGLPWGITPLKKVLRASNSTAQNGPPAKPVTYNAYWCMTEAYNFYRPNVIDLIADVTARRASETWALINLPKMCSQRASYKDSPTCFATSYNKDHDQDKAIRQCRLQATLD